LTVDGVKMSKSLGNFTTITDVLKRHSPEVIRAFVLSAHYTNPIDFSDEALNAAAKGWERIFNAVRLTRRALNTAPVGGDGNGFLTQLEQTKTAFASAMDDDFNAPIAIAALQELTREVNTLLNSGTTVALDVLKAIDETYTSLAGDVLGILPKGNQIAGDVNREDALIEIMINMRAQARANKNWAESDRIRDELAKIGIILEDRADGTVWKAV
ncbi:MAG: cysteine--tRNA ligase, partial [Anaerolineae bacterium]|nr:cysteine--tRNA ligase [Anaerolineae bacterium]